MKKIICLILCVAFVAAIAGCGKANTSSDDGVDIEYYAKLGRIPESKYSLGNAVDTVKDELADKAEKDDTLVYNVTEGNLTVLINTGEFCYYYMKENAEKGISYIVDLNTAFGFKLGTVSIEIKEALPDYKPTEADADEQTLFFMNYGSNCTFLKYIIEGKVLLFVFEDNALCATALYNPDNWTL